MKKTLKKIKKLLVNPVYNLVYKTLDGRTELYTITKPKHANEFGNVAQGLRTAGFRASCRNRDGEVRSFRYDRIVALHKQ